VAVVDIEDIRLVVVAVVVVGVTTAAGKKNLR